MKISISISENKSKKETDENLAREFEFQILKSLQLRQKELDPKKFRSTSESKKK
jgi:hypothetical protein